MYQALNFDSVFRHYVECRIKRMQAVADIKLLVKEGIITSEQAEIIEAKARETMVYLAINALLCFGIIAATGGFIAWLGTPASVATTGLLFSGMGVLILAYASELFRMFGNASMLIGAGMLIGGASVELMSNYEQFAGAAMSAGGFIIAGGAAWFFKSDRVSARFVIGSITLMGVAMHLVGIAFFLDQTDISGAPIVGFYLYATVALVMVGLLTDVRLVTALAIIPFAQALDTSTNYFHAAYAFYSPETTLSIIQMAALIALCLWIAAQQPERIARHARVLAVMAFVVANLCALVGSLWGDWIGETIWGPTFHWEPNTTMEQQQAAWREFEADRAAFRETALHVSYNVFSVFWAAALAALILSSAHKAQRGLFNASLTFAGIHLYTQFFESYYDEPLAYVIGGVAAIPIAWGMWRLDNWIVAKRDQNTSSKQPPSSSG